MIDNALGNRCSIRLSYGDFGAAPPAYSRSKRGVERPPKGAEARGAAILIGPPRSVRTSEARRWYRDRPYRIGDPSRERR